MRFECQAAFEDSEAAFPELNAPITKCLVTVTIFKKIVTHVLRKKGI